MCGIRGCNEKEGGFFLLDIVKRERADGGGRSAGSKLRFCFVVHDKLKSPR